MSVSINHFHKQWETTDLTFNSLTFNNLSELTGWITFFLLILLHTVNKIDMYGLLLYIDLFNSKRNLTKLV